ncbi:hypothetical protein EV363DRAFT_416270 [Boletus edulis]|nr:hypothetical protein EV363DRAFT_416270 [Boletus edulis]
MFVPHNQVIGVRPWIERSGETWDSIEDARTAPRLYNHSMSSEGRGVFDVKLEELYRSGKQDNWKPPPTMPMATPVSACKVIAQPSSSLLPSTLCS